MSRLVRISLAGLAVPAIGVFAMGAEAQDLIKQELIGAVARQSGVEPDKADAVLMALVAIIETKLAKGEAVVVAGLGKFAIEKLDHAEGRNPATGVVITIPAFNRPVFFPAKSLKDAVNK
jgi:DNA-binding protein HU-beta